MGANAVLRLGAGAATGSGSPHPLARPLLMRRYRIEIAVCVALAALTLGTMGPGCWNGFTNYDDNDYVTNNRQVKAGLSIASVRWAFTTMHAANWHPLTWLSLELDTTLFGDSAWGYHLTNLLLHTANVLLLFLALRRLTGAVWRSAAAAALFAVHPAHVESVAWVAERKDVLSGLFWMLTMLAYAWYVERPGWKRYLLVATVFALGLMAKPMLVTLPCVLLLLDYWPLGRLKSDIRYPKSEGNPKPEIPMTQTGSPGFWSLGIRFLNFLRISSFGFRILEKLPLFALTAAACLVTMAAQKGAMSSLERLPFRERVLNTVAAYGAYLGELVWPTKLAVLYPHPHGGLPLEDVARAALILAAITGLVLWARRRRYLAVGWLWFLGTLVPVIGLVQVGAQSMADRYTYLPYIGLFIAISWGVGDLAARRPAATRAILAPAALLLGLWAPLAIWALTGNGTQMMQDGLLYRFVVGLTVFAVLGWATGWLAGLWPARVSPLVPALTLILGIWIALSAWQTRLWLTSIWLWEYTVAVTPDNPLAHNALGDAYWNSKHPNRIELAREHFLTTLRLTPQHAKAHNNLALILTSEGRLDEAAAHFAAAWAVGQTLPVIPLNWGVVLARQGHPEAALGKFDQALRLEPDMPVAHSEQGRALAALRRWPEAELAFQQAVKLDPNRLDFRADLGWALWHLGHVSAAEEEYAIVMKGDKEWAENARSSAWIFATDPQAGRRSGYEAVRRAEEACQARGVCDAHFLDTLAAAYAEAGAVNAAVLAARQALELACDDEELRAEVWQRLVVYLERRPYRQSV
jgi:protein O-mannosyl-transferase